MRSKKVILDTNLWISFLISNNLKEIDSLINAGTIKLIFSDELIEEFVTVARRPKFKRYFSESNLNELLRLFDLYGKLIKVKVMIHQSRDVKDNFLLSLAVESKADFLVTGDEDLLVIKKIKRTKIVTWSDFMSNFK